MLQGSWYSSARIYKSQKPKNLSRKPVIIQVRILTHPLMQQGMEGF